MDRGLAYSTFLLCLLLLFPFSSARTLLDVFGIDHTVTNHDSLSNTDKNHAEAEASFEPTTMIQWEPQTTDIPEKISKPKEDLPTESSKASSESDPPSPLTLVRFRPINPPPIPRRPLPLFFRLGHRRCRHNNHRFMSRNPRLSCGEIPYGNDVIPNRVEDQKNSDAVARGGMRQIPGRGMRFRRIEPMFPSRHHHHHHERESRNTGLMKRIRKFLNHF